MKKFSFALNIIATAALAAVLGYFSVTKFTAYDVKTSILNYVILLAVSLPVATVLHELGHLLFGAFVGIKAVPKLSFVNSSSCDIIPKTEKNLRGKIIFTTLGGIFVNALCIVLGGLAFVFNAIPAEISAIIPASFYLLLLNALPFWYSGGKSDGLVIRELAKNTDGAKVLLGVLTIQAQILKGKPIEEVDEKLLFDLPQIQEDDQSFIALTELRYEYFKAKGDEKQAEFYKNRFEELKNTYL
ncbi:MAG: hypothetical protein K2H30_00010 [Clostridia bacterium]|nr:hypothetical protein [Clostridia bacterium]